MSGYLRFLNDRWQLRPFNHYKFVNNYIYNVLHRPSHNETPTFFPILEHIPRYLSLIKIANILQKHTNR